MSVAKMKEYYVKGLWTKAMVDRLYKLGKISEEEYKEIVGDTTV
jgi:hypothetical protein